MYDVNIIFCQGPGSAVSVRWQAMWLHINCSHSVGNPAIDRRPNQTTSLADFPSVLLPAYNCAQIFYDSAQKKIIRYQYKIYILHRSTVFCELYHPTLIYQQVSLTNHTDFLLPGPAYSLETQAYSP